MPGTVSVFTSEIRRVFEVFYGGLYHRMLRVPLTRPLGDGPPYWSLYAVTLPLVTRLFPFVRTEAVMGSIACFAGKARVSGCFGTVSSLSLLVSVFVSYLLP